MTEINRHSIESAQLDSLRHLVELCLSQNRFYQSKWRDAGLHQGPSSFRDYQSRWPTTVKSEIISDQTKNPPYGSNLSFPLEQYTRYHQTSGTTGSPIRCLDTPESWDALVENWMQVYLVAGLNPADRVFFAFSFGPFLGFWMAFSAAERLGALCIPGGGMSSKARLKVMRQNAATVLCCTPTYALHLGEVLSNEGLAPTELSLKTIIIAGEPGGSIPATRQRLEATWPGVRFVDHHGMTEVGPVTYECPVRKGVLHVIEKGYFAEVLEPQTLNPVKPGERGELVLTTLNRAASPLLRYRTGDWVKAPDEQKCGCGRWEKAFEGGILGRIDDMVIVRGVNLYPSAVEAVLRGFRDVVEFQAHVQVEKALNELMIEIELKAGADRQKVQQDIQNRLQETFALRIPVAVREPGSLPRYEMKAKRWIRS